MRVLNGLYCLFYIDIGILPFYKKDNRFIQENYNKLLKNHTHITKKIFESQESINILKNNNIAIANEINIKSIYGRYIE